MAASTPPERKRISSLSVVALCAVAITFDGLQMLFALTAAVPVVGIAIAVVFGWLIAFTAYITFWLWYKLMGIDLLDNILRKGMAMGLTFICEMILSILPGITIGVVAMIFVVRAEDKLFNAKQREALLQAIKAYERGGAREVFAERRQIMQQYREMEEAA